LESNFSTKPSSILTNASLVRRYMRQQNPHGLVDSAVGCRASPQLAASLFGFLHVMYSDLIADVPVVSSSCTVVVGNDARSLTAHPNRDHGDDYELGRLQENAHDAPSRLKAIIMPAHGLYLHILQCSQVSSRRITRVDVTWPAIPPPPPRGIMLATK
jgi:hypothetical protein